MTVGVCETEVAPSDCEQGDLLEALSAEGILWFAVLLSEAVLAVLRFPQMAPPHLYSLLFSPLPQPFDDQNVSLYPWQSGQISPGTGFSL